MNIAVISESHKQLIQYMDFLFEVNPPDFFDCIEDFEKVKDHYNLVLIDHQVKGKSWNDIYIEGVKYIVLTTNPLHWYKLEFFETLWKPLEMIYNLKGVFHAEKTQFDRIKYLVQSLNLDFTCKNLIKKLYY